MAVNTFENVRRNSFDYPVSKPSNFDLFYGNYGVQSPYADQSFASSVPERNKEFQNQSLPSSAKAGNALNALFVKLDNKSFKCTLCEYATPISTNIKNHVRTHTGEMPFRCIFCSQKFLTKSNLKVHVVYKHKEHAEMSGLFKREWGWHQWFEHAISWDMVTWCNNSRRNSISPNGFDSRYPPTSHHKSIGAIK